MTKINENLYIGETSIQLKNVNVYSTEEIVVGTLFGKPLYRKSIIFPNGTGNTSTNSYSLSSYGITNVDEIYIANPSYYMLYGRRYPMNYNDGNSYMSSVSPTTLEISLEYMPIATSKVCITLEYNKTTD